MSGSMSTLYNPETGLVGNRNDPRYAMAMRLMDAKVPDAIPGRTAGTIATIGSAIRGLMAAKLMGDAKSDGQAAAEEQRSGDAEFGKRMAGLLGGDTPTQAPATEQQAAPPTLPAPARAVPAGGGGGAITPPPEQMQAFQDAAARFKVPVETLVAQHFQESGFDPSRTGAAGEIGAGQILPSTAANPGYGMAPLSAADARDPNKSIPWSADYLTRRASARGIDMSNPDPANQSRGLASYNGAGPQADAYGQKVAGLISRVQLGGRDPMAQQVSGPPPQALANRLMASDGGSKADTATTGSGLQQAMAAKLDPSSARPDPASSRMDPNRLNQLNMLAAEAAGSPNPLTRGRAPMLATLARTYEGQLQQQQMYDQRRQDLQDRDRTRALDRADAASQRAQDRAAASDLARQNRPVTTRDVLDDDGKVRTYAINPNGTRGAVVGLAAKQPDAPGSAAPFAGNGMEQQSANALIQLGPKVQDGTATPDEHARYALAYNHMQQGTVQPVPDPRDPTGKTMVLARIPGNIPQGFPPPRMPGQAVAQGAGLDTTAPGVGGPGAAGAGPTGGGAPGAPPPASPVDPRAPQIIPGTARPDKDANEAERVAAGFASRMAAADEIMGRVGAPGGSDMAAGKLGGVGNFFMSSAGQQYQQAAQAWVRAKLRKESGAAIGVDEMRQELATYFPQPGDGADVIEQKRVMREGETRAMRMAAGRAYGMADPATVPSRAGQVSGQQPTAAAPARVSSAEDYARVPSGSLYTSPDGQTRRKP